MAYATKELKTKVVNLIKDQAKAKDIKITLNAKIVHHSTLKVNISACSIDLRQNMIETLQNRMETMKKEGGYSVSEWNSLEKTLNENINATIDKMETYGLGFNLHYLDRFFSGDALALIRDVIKSIKCDHYDNSDYASDYFDTAYYWALSIGKNKGGLVVKS